MNSRERVLLAVEHKEPDRVPLDFYATPEVWQKLREHFQVTDDEGVLHAFEVDFRYVGPRYHHQRGNDTFTGNKKRDPDGSWEDLWGVRWRPKEFKVGTYDEIFCSPLAEAETVSDIENHSWPAIEWYDYSRIAADSMAYDEYAVYTGWPSIFQIAQNILSMEKLLIDLALRPELIEALFQRITDFYCAWLERTLAAGGGRIDFVNFSDDLGIQNGLFISPDMIRAFVFPCWRRIIKVCADYEAKVWLHCCGSIRQLIPDFIQLGIDMLDPVQVSARDMDPSELKKEFGAKITFHGAVDTQYILPHGSVEDVRNEVKQRLQELAPGGGYVLLPVHAVQPDVPLENIIAVYETALEYGRYDSGRVGKM